MPLSCMSNVRQWLIYTDKNLWFSCHSYYHRKYIWSFMKGGGSQVINDTWGCWRNWKGVDHWWPLPPCRWAHLPHGCVGKSKMVKYFITFSLTAKYMVWKGCPCKKWGKNHLIQQLEKDRKELFAIYRVLLLYLHNITHDIRTVDAMINVCWFGK